MSPAVNAALFESLALVNDQIKLFIEGQTVRGDPSTMRREDRPYLARLRRVRRIILTAVEQDQ